VTCWRTPASKPLRQSHKDLHGRRCPVEAEIGAGVELDAVASLSRGCGTVLHSISRCSNGFVEKFTMSSKRTAKGAANATSLHRRIHGELVDSFDEELEMEIDDDRLARLLTEIADHPEQKTIDRRFYFQELLRLQCELVKLQDWVVHQKLKVVVIFEGRDAAGKGGVIKRITQRMNPRVCRVAALPAPSERERTQWYFQRYVSHLPAGGEIVLFDRSWYNRAGVERVMGFCTDADYEEFFHTVPEFEKMLVRSGIVLIKYWFSITDDEQHLRFLMRVHDPLKQWKLSPMDLESRRRWEQYTKAKEVMLERSHIAEAPWWIVEAVDKKRARLNCISHLLSQFAYREIPHDDPVLPERVHNPNYLRGPIPKEMFVPEVY
jgi:polyphosphate kinase